MKSDDMLKDRIRECPEYDCFTTVALSCHREIVPEVILYYYDVYCNNKYYISTFYKKFVRLLHCQINCCTFIAVLITIILHIIKSANLKKILLYIQNIFTKVEHIKINKDREIDKYANVFFFNYYFCILNKIINS